MSKQEAKLKSNLMIMLRQALPKYVLFRHEDKFTSGIPDISITGFAKTSWFEVKHATPDFDSPGIQELTMLRLAAAGFHARYIIFTEDKNGDFKKTFIIHPKYIKLFSQKDGVAVEASCLDFNNKFLLEYIRGVHEGRS